MIKKPRVVIVGAGSLAHSLALALRESAYTITEIISRDSAVSRQRARRLAVKAGARVATNRGAGLDGELLWFCVPDGEIRRAAKSLALRAPSTGVRFAFHSSGALGSGELEALRAAGIAVASVHPLMTFVRGAQPSFAGVPVALEGDAAAVKVARRIVRDLGGESFLLPARRKAAYHAWATMTSPLLVAYLVTLEAAARAAGLARADARRMSLPIMRETIENCARLGPADSFSGPFVRGDRATVAKHLALLWNNPRARAVYVALARAALAWLPVRNRKELRQLLEDC